MEEPRSRIFLPSRCQSLSTPTVEEEVQGWLKTFLWILEDDQAVASIKKVLALVLGQLGMTIDRSLHKVQRRWSGKEFSLYALIGGYEVQEGHD